MGLVSGALENLKQDEVADQERFSAGGGFESHGCRRLMAPQLGNPDGAIDEYHDRGVSRS
jgi:hypothetical protein